MRLRSCRRWRRCFISASACERESDERLNKEPTCTVRAAARRRNRRSSSTLNHFGSARFDQRELRRLDVRAGRAARREHDGRARRRRRGGARRGGRRALGGGGPVVRRAARRAVRGAPLRARRVGGAPRQCSAAASTSSRGSSRAARRASKLSAWRASLRSASRDWATSSGAAVLADPPLPHCGSTTRRSACARVRPRRRRRVCEARGRGGDARAEAAEHTRDGRRGGRADCEPPLCARLLPAARGRAARARIAAPTASPRALHPRQRAATIASPCRRTPIASTQAWPGSTLRIVEGGAHALFEIPMRAAAMLALRELRGAERRGGGRRGGGGGRKRREDVISHSQRRI